MQVQTDIASCGRHSVGAGHHASLLYTFLFEETFTVKSGYNQIPLLSASSSSMCPVRIQFLSHRDMHTRCTSVEPLLQHSIIGSVIVHHWLNLSKAVFSDCQEGHSHNSASWNAFSVKVKVSTYLPHALSIWSQKSTQFVPHHCTREVTLLGDELTYFGFSEGSLDTGIFHHCWAYHEYRQSITERCPLRLSLLTWIFPSTRKVSIFLLFWWLYIT